MTTDDLRHADGDIRYLVFDWTYSSSLGSGLHDREQASFHVDDIREKATSGGGGA